MIYDIKGDEMFVIDVFFVVIKYMKDCFLKEFNEKDYENVVEVDNIRWVLIVLVIWDDIVK